MAMTKVKMEHGQKIKNCTFIRDDI